MSTLDAATYSAAVRVAALQRRRNNLAAAVEQVKVGQKQQLAFVLLCVLGMRVAALQRRRNNLAAAVEQVKVGQQQQQQLACVLICV